MKTIKLLTFFAAILLLFPGFSYAGINPDKKESCKDNAMSNPKTYTITVDFPGILDCSALNGCGCSFQIALYECGNCNNIPGSCNLIPIYTTPYIYGVTSYSIPPQKVDPDQYGCICAYFEDITNPPPCGCRFNPDHDCHDISGDPSTSFTLNLYPCFH